MRFLLLLLSVFVLSACNITAYTSVKLTDLLSKEEMLIPGELIVEVAACSDSSDSRKMSRSLVEIVQKIPTVFPDAEFKECYRKDFQSMASFSLPFQMDKVKDGKGTSDDHINISSNEAVLLAITIPEKLRQNIKQMQKGSVNYDIDLQLNIINDTGADFNFNIISSYIGTTPYVYDSLTVTKDGQFTITLSDVSVDSALEYGFVTIMSR